MRLEIALLWIGIVFYAAAVVTLTYGVVFGKSRASLIGLGGAVGGFVFHTASIVTRVIASGRLPVAENYENTLAGAWVMVLSLLVVVAVDRKWATLGLFILPVSLITLGIGATTDTMIAPLTPAYRSSWLVIHVAFAWFTYAAYTVAASLGVLVLLGARASRLGRVASLLPGDPEQADDLMTRVVGVGFLLNAVMIASGAIWAYRLWGSYWSWDPVETWSFITWLAFGLYLHMRLIVGWSGRRLAWIAVLALFGVLMSFWGVQFAPTSYHLFRDLGGTILEQSRPQ